jgi:hypothetical protein
VSGSYEEGFIEGYLAAFRDLDGDGSSPSDTWQRAGRSRSVAATSRALRVDPFGFLPPCQAREMTSVRHTRG